MISLNTKMEREGGLARLNFSQKKSGGFTLLELLIVISIIAILSIALVFMLNPAETLKKARDAQRISDLKTVKTALGIWLTSTSTPRLDTPANPICTTDVAGTGAGNKKIAYSVAVVPTLGVLYGGTDSAASTGTTTFATAAATSSTAGKVDGTGWIPVNLRSLTSGTPISSFPVDPVNTVSGTVAKTDLVYRYACQNGTSATFGVGKPAYIFEIDAVLESNAYTTEDAKMSKDGGDNDDMYEQGNSLNLLPITGSAF